MASSRSRVPLGLGLCAALAGCGGGGHHRQPASAAAKPPAAKPVAPRPAPAAAPAHLSRARRCPGMRRVRCATLTVPLDHSGRVAGTLRLRVGFAGPTKPARGVLVFLTGGPGQPGVSFIPRVTSRLRPALRGYRVVMLDQRGTGHDALRCPALQRQVGTSDLTLPTPAAVRQCAAAIGPDRRFYSTADTVADLEALRAALGAPKLTLDGVSYGTFVAERYALAHPDRVARLVLDSVLVHSGYDVFDLVPLHATARVLSTLCAEQHCRTDPVADLAAVVRRYHDGAQILDTLTAYSVGAPSFPGWLEALHAARGGHPRALRRKLAAVRLGQRATATVLSQGLHASTLCADDPAPWGGPNAPLASRGPALARALARLTPAATYPYDRATMVGNGALQTCRRWPPMAPAPAPRPRELPAVPVLLLAGDHDLSTPLEWARREAAVAPEGQLVVIHGAGHGPSLRAKSNRARVALARFLQG